MTNYYEQIIELYNETDRQKRGYAFEQIVREIQPWSHKPPVSAVGKGEQLDGVFEWENNIFLVEAKAKESKILQGSKDWEDFELKIRRRNKSVVGLFLSLYDVDNSIIERCKSMNQEGYRIFVIYGNLWEKLVSEPIGFELIIRYLLIYSRINYIPTVNSIKEVKDWFFRTEDILKNYNDICIKYSSPFLRRFKMDQHESLYVKRETDNKLESYLMNLYPKALSREKKIKTFTSNTNVKIYETDRLTPPQIIIIRDVCGAGKTTFAIENALNETKYISFSKSASEQNIDIELVAFLENLGQDYGLLELYEINRPIIAVIDSLDESQRITNKYPEIKSIISFVSHLNTVSKKYGFYAFPIAIVFTIREEYWRDWEALFEGQNVKHFFKTLSEYNETEFALALKKYQQVYRYNICNKLSKSDISVLSNPLNLYIFSETYKYSGNITISEVFTANVLHNYFKNKSEEVMKRGITYLTPRVFLDICERFLCLCVYNSLNLNRNDFYNCIKHEFKLFDPYTDEIIRLYESESIFRFDEFGILVIRHLKYLEYLYADFMIENSKRMTDNETDAFLEDFIDRIQSTRIVDLIEIYNNVKYLSSINKEKSISRVKIFLDKSNNFVRIQLMNVRSYIAQGCSNRISEYDELVCGKNITDGRLLLEAFLACAAKCNRPNYNDLIGLFVKAWKANKGNL